MKLGDIFITIYQSLIGLVMFAWVGALIIVFVKFFEEQLMLLHPIFRIAFIIGSINLLLLSLTKNWSFFPYNTQETNEKLKVENE